MSVAAPALFAFEHTYASGLSELTLPWQAAQAPAPRLLALDDELAAELGADPGALRSPEGVAALVGNLVPEGAQPVAMAYAGHQFGSFVPQLGDGRALLLGEVVDVHGRRRDLHLKGSGRTPFARGGDGKAVVGPMLREWIVGEGLHALGVPTSRALAVVATGEDVHRGPMLPGAVLVRVAASHIRVGTFQYVAARGDRDLLRRLADHAIDRHHPAAREADDPYLALFEHVVEAQADLVARWMLVGFIHGVMNTDNMTISGETIDLGPCAFMDGFDPETVFSSIDHGGRYAYGNQPILAQWDLARLAEALLPLLGDDKDAAIGRVKGVLDTFPARYGRHWMAGVEAKLGLPAGDHEALVNDLPAILQPHRIDFTSFFRSLSAVVRGDDRPVRGLFLEPSEYEAWAARWLERLPEDREAVADAMDRVNPVHIPRNHLVEEALAAATEGDLDPAHRLVGVLRRPFEERPGLERYAEPAPGSWGSYQTFCGT